MYYDTESREVRVNRKHFFDNKVKRSVADDELKNYMDHLYKVNEDDLLFPVSKSYLHHEMLRGCKLSGVKVIRIHDLRHSHITMLIENGYSAKDVGSRAGHSAERITFKYAHAYAEKGKEMANTLSDLERGEK